MLCWKEKASWWAVLSGEACGAASLSTAQQLAWLHEAECRCQGAGQQHGLTPRLCRAVAQLGLKPQRNGSVLQEAVPGRAPAVEKERSRGGAILSTDRTKVLCLEALLGAQILPAALGKTRLVTFLLLWEVSSAWLFLMHLSLPHK